MASAETPLHRPDRRVRELVGAAGARRRYMLRLPYADGERAQRECGAQHAVVSVHVRALRPARVLDVHHHGRPARVRREHAFTHRSRDRHGYSEEREQREYRAKEDVPDGTHS